jgi:hypothetical protein
MYMPEMTASNWPPPRPRIRPGNLVSTKDGRLQFPAQHLGHIRIETDDLVALPGSGG